MTTAIDNAEDIIDSRDIIERLEWLNDNLDDLNDDEKAELAALTNLAKQGEDYAPDWQYGEALIRYSYFTDYARELLVDCGDLPANIPHYIEIDWEATARNIMVDYTHIDFDGVAYLIR